MITVSIDLDNTSEHGHFPISITKNDRGEWEVLESEHGISLMGFGGENFIHFHLMSMQSGKVSVVMVQEDVDSYHVVETFTSTWRDPEEFNKKVNEIVAKFCDYPEQL